MNRDRAGESIRGLSDGLLKGLEREEIRDFKLQDL
jgi:hypothetical protein